MHFTTLYLLKEESLDNISEGLIVQDFTDRYCYCCGESNPSNREWCDWFQVGGRWADILKAKKGIKGELTLLANEEERKQFLADKEHFSIINIEDLLEDIKEDNIYAIADQDQIYCKEEGSEEKFKLLLRMINKKLIKGVVALIDCHD